MQNKVEHVEDTPSESEGLIKTPRQLIVVIFLAFLIPIVSIFLLVKLVSVTSPMGAGSDAQTSEAIAQRIHPVAGFKLVDAAVSDAPEEARTGQQVYELTCATCHAAGVAGAPKLGDNAEWAPLIETGFDQMVKIAIEGVGAMPPRGGNSSLSDTEVARAVAYMANNSGGSFDEPAEDADAAAETDTGAEAASQEAAPAADEAPQAAAAPDATEETQQPEVAGEDATEAEAATDTDAATEQAADTTDEAPQAATDAASPDPAEVQQILTANACLACHAVENKMIGPAYRDVAEKYADDPGASETIAQHVKEGSSGIWGPIPMPPNPGISNDDLTKVVDWILAGAPQ